MMNRIIILFSLLFLVSCANPKPRRPITSSGAIDMSASIQLNKRIYEQEIQYFKLLMQRDSQHTYINSQHGFWYAYINKVEAVNSTPVKGDQVIFSYDIKDIYGNEIYSQDELGTKTYAVDQEDFMQGIQEGIKLMRVDEKVLFLLPSLKAYGVYGDGKKIKTNTPLIVTIELISIQ